MKKITFNFTVILLIITILSAEAQVGIGTTDPKSLLDIPASNGSTPTNTDGILIPRIDNFPTTDPTADQNSMVVFLTRDITGYSKGFHYWDNTIPDWVPFATEEWKDGVNASGDDLIYASQARISGTDVVITDDGRVGFGTDDPVERFEFKGPGDNDFQITSANTNPPNFILYNTGGTLASPGAFTVANQEIGSFIVKTHDGSGVREPGGFRFYIEGLPSPGSTPTRFVINTTPVGSTSQQPRLIVRSTGNTGLSEQNPTATLHIRAGTATANSAPLKFTSGTNLTTPEAGAVEYNGADLLFTPTTSRQILMRGYRATAALNFPAITNSTSRQLTVTVTGATAGSSCSCAPTAIEANFTWNCYVSAANTVTVRLYNGNTGTGSFDPPSTTWKITVLE